MKQIVFLINCCQEYLSHKDLGSNAGAASNLLCSDADGREASASGEAARFFASVAQVYLPLLDMFSRLENDNVPYRVALVLPSSLLTMLSDPFTVSQFMKYMDSRIEFGNRCLPLCRDDERDALQSQIDDAKDKRQLFESEYRGRLLNAFAEHERRGNLEILATCATNIFLPHYIDIEETLSAQIETGLYAYKTFFADKAQGFFLPEMGYVKGLEQLLRSYGVAYTVLDARAVLFSADTAPCGIFSPVLCGSTNTASQIAAFASDDKTSGELFGQGGYASGADYCDTERDIAFTVKAQRIEPFILPGKQHFPSFYRCWSNSGHIYDKAKAHEAASEDARLFIKRRLDLFNKAEALLPDTPLSLTCVIDSNSLLDKWQEGIDWLECAIRSSVDSGMTFATFKEVLSSARNMATIRPYFSADCGNGYGENLNSGNNQWMLPPIRRASRRMTALADRFSDGSNIKARLLNLGAKELMLAQSCTWQKRINKQPQDTYAATRFMEGIKAFTTVFEDLGSSSFTPAWLTSVESEHLIFPWINYKVFCKKQ